VLDEFTSTFASNASCSLREIKLAVRYDIQAFASGCSPSPEAEVLALKLRRPSNVHI